MSKTLDQIFLSSAESCADQIALTVCPQSARLGSDLDNLQLTYKQGANYLHKAANFFRNCGLREGDVVFVQLPNGLQTPLILLSLLNAGLVPCLIPTHWRRSELEKALQSIQPNAVLVQQVSCDYDPFSTMFEIAADIISVRFIFGVGETLPDGVTPVPGLADPVLIEEAEEIVFRRSPEQVAFIGWSSDQEGQPHPVAYTHFQLMANSYLINERIELVERLSALTSYNITSLPGLVGAFIPWLLEGGQMHLTSDLRPDALVNSVVQHNCNFMVLPLGIAPKLMQALNDSEMPEAVWPYKALIASSPVKAISSTDLTGKSTVLYNLNGLCLIPKTTDDGQKGLLKLGPLPDKDGQSLTPLFLTSRLQGATQRAGDETEIMQGRLEIGGTAVGFTNWQANMTNMPHSNFDEHWEKTYLTASLIDQGMSLLEIVPNEDTIYYGNSQLCGQELDRLYQAYPGFVDAAAFAIEDPLLGERLFAAIIPQPGDALSFDDFKQHLMAQNVSPAKIPEKLVTVCQIPRNPDGLIERQEILRT